ncbi:NAD(P)-dependent oxidoreductase [Methylocapsa sp. S129]|uniref:NAD(P)-dependent oxidoreductase n=1 Tax=Methylocapsa sp. S129 TaxID=1641869 RepID=UPI00131AC7F4|nr:NAD(P)-dependent oxidoreductase [Methylocapsa sp. S129]
MQIDGEERALAIHVEGEDPAPWLEAFHTAFPDWRVLRSDQIDAGATDQVAVVVVWAPPSGFLGQFPNLKQIFSIGAGTDHLSSDPSRPLRVPVIPRQEPASTRAMAEFVLMQALLHHRRVGDSIMHRSAKRWEPEPRGPVAGCRISILGFGPMAQATAELLVQFGCRVTAWSRTPKSSAIVNVLSGWSALDAMFQNPDLLINLLPSTDETRGLIDERRLSLLPRGAGFINVGRGDAVEQSALLRLLDSGHLSLASLDVLRSEPPPANDPVWTHPRVILTPHVASSPIPAGYAAWVATKISL